MDLLKKLAAGVSKYRFAALILILGLVLMLLPLGDSGSEGQEMESTQAAQQTLTLAEELEQILSRIEGVGAVEVMLTVAAGETSIYQYDENGSGRDTVIITDAGRGESGLIQQVNPPVYRGAVVVCQGADSAAVRLDIVQAVSNLTGISSDRITVLKMK